MANEILIANFWAREILDARGVPTLEVTLFGNNQAMVTVSISTGAADEVQFTNLTQRDPQTTRLGSLSLQPTVDLLNTQIGPQLIGQNPANQEQIDQIILNQANQLKGQNIENSALMLLSLATLKAGASSYGWPIYYYLWRRYQLVSQLSIPTPLFGMFNGGVLGNDNVDFYESQIIPANNIPFTFSLQMAITTFNNLRKVLTSRGGGQATSNLGGFIPVLYKNTDSFDLLVEAVKASSLVMGRDIFFGADLDASHFFNLGRYKLKDAANALNTEAMITYLKKLHTSYGVYMVEDPFDKDDQSSWKKFTAEMGESMRTASDRLTNSQPDQIQKAIDQKLCNTFIIKPGQCQTVTQLVQSVNTIRQAGLQFVIAHREGETTDDLLADIAVGLGANYCKFGAPNRGERIAKYNRLLKIETEINQINANATT